MLPSKTKRVQKVSATNGTVALALAVIASTCFLAVDEDRGGQQRERQLARAAARLPARPFQGLAGDIDWAPFAGSETLGGGADLDALADDLLTFGQKHPDDAAAQDRAAIAALVLRRPVDAVHALRRATALAPGNPGYWADLAAALQDQARTRHDPQVLVEALAASDQSLHIQPEFRSALFNRAVILESLGLDGPATIAYGAVIRGGTTRRAEEAAAGLRRLRKPTRKDSWQKALATIPAAGDERLAAIVRDFPQEARAQGETMLLSEWGRLESAGDHAAATAPLALARRLGRAVRQRSGESLLADTVAAIDRATPTRRKALAEGHPLYQRGRQAYTARQPTAGGLFASAVETLRAGGSPLALEAEYFSANCLADQHRYEEALATLDRLRKQTPARYRALQAHLHWQRGTIMTVDGRVNEVLRESLQALAIFRDLGETGSALRMTSTAAAAYALLGRRPESWRMRVTLFHGMSEGGDLAGIQQALDLAARTEAIGRRWEAAHALLGVAVEPQLRLNARIASSSLLWRALSAQRIGWEDNAAADLAEARTAAAAIPAPEASAEALSDVILGEASLLRPRDPARAETLLTTLIDQTERTSRQLLLPEALLERARARRALHRDQAAISDLQRALQSLAARTGEQDHSYRDAYFAASDAVVRELVDLYDRRDDVSAALAAARRGAVVPAAIPPDAGTVIVRYLSLPDRLLAFVTAGGEVRRISVRVSSVELERTANALARCIERGTDHCIPSLALLGGWLVDPVEGHLAGASTLMIVPDASLAGVPFSALKRTATGRRLIEDLAIVIADGGSPSRPPEKGALGGPLVAVGNPAFDQEAYPTLDPLPAAELEAADVIRAYGRGTLLTGREATAGRVVPALENAAVADLGTHAVAAPNDPSASCLLLAPSGSASGSLTLHEIEHLHLQNLQLVVLCGCRTATPVEGGGATTSLALAFLRAGAHGVIASLWDVDDSTGRQISHSLHRQLLTGTTPAEALRQVQTSMLRSSDRRLRRLKSWSGLRVYAPGS